MGVHNDHDYTIASRPKTSTPICSEVSKRYHKVSTIAEGSFGEVFKAWDKKSGDIVALKRLKTDTTPDEEIPLWAQREVKILQDVDHENIVNLVEMCLLPGFMGEPEYYLAMEYCPCDLNKVIYNNDINLQTDHIREIMQQIFSGLEYLHDVKGVLHRDLKPANILVDKEGILKIADFGMSRLMEKNQEQNSYTSQVCTLWFRAPELLLGSRNYGPEVDMWSAGLIMAYLFAGDPILESQTEQGMLTYISKLFGSITPEVWPGVEELPLYKVITLPQEEDRKVEKILGIAVENPSALELIDNLLVLDPKERLSAKDALQSTFILESSTKGKFRALLDKHRKLHPARPNKRAWDAEETPEDCGPMQKKNKLG